MEFKPNDHFVNYLYFIQERMNIFWNRIEEKTELTDDPIFQKNKFTNAYRVLDRASQYLLKNVIYNERGMKNDYATEDIFWRIILYKHFNLPATWEALEKEFGDITLDVQFKDIVAFLKDYQQNHAVYSNAYMLTCPFMRKPEFLSAYGLPKGPPKFQIYLSIFSKDLLNNGQIYRILASGTFEEAFEQFKKVLGIADFLAYQFVQDLCYSPLFNFDMNSFCAAGPGTKRGIMRTFDLTGTVDYQEVVKWVHKNYDSLVKEYSDRFQIDLRAKMIPGLPMMVPDFSNCFCETDKYMRASGIKHDKMNQGRMKQVFRPNPTKIEFMFPPKWDVKL